MLMFDLIEISGLNVAKIPYLFRMLKKKKRLQFFTFASAFLGVVLYCVLYFPLPYKATVSVAAVFEWRFFFSDRLESFVISHMRAPKWELFG